MNTLRYALRQLRQQPGFAAVAILTLALGLGANATILGLIHAIFFEPLHARQPERLAMLLQKSSAWKFPHGHSWLDFQDYRRRVPEFEDAAALFMTPAHLALPGRQPERTWIECVSGNYFAMLGIAPALGSVFQTTDVNGPRDLQPIVLGHRYWQRSLGGDPSVVGRTIHLNGKPFVVMGVMPERFTGAQWGFALGGWVPVATLPSLLEGGKGMLESRSAPAFKVVTRLADGASLDRARATVEGVARQLAAEYPENRRESTIQLVPERRCRPEPTFSEIMPFAAAMFLALVFLVLLIACANVANLMFSRAVVRQREMGIRTAIGASRWQLVRQLLAECIVLSLIAGLVGTAWSQGFGLLLQDLSPAGDIPVRTEGSWSWGVFGASVLVAILAGLITGLGPALRATRLDIQTVLKDGGGALLASSRHPFRTLLVVSQIALCLVVLVAGALFVSTLRQVNKIDLGFRSENLVMASLDLGLQGYNDSRGREFLEAVRTRSRAIPGIVGATVARAVPFDYGVTLTDVGAEGGIVEGGPADHDGYHISGWNAADPDYFATLGVTLMAGRSFSRFDRVDSPKVAVVNQTLAQRLWPGTDPIGKRFRFGRNGDWHEVVGVARDGKYVMVGEEPRPYFYVPLEQHYQSPVTLHLRTSENAPAAIPAMRQILAELDPNLPIYNVRTMDEHLRQSAMALMPLRMAATLAGVQGGLGLVLAVMGLYGVVAYGVSQRNREIGVRIALGARRLDVIRLVVREGWRLTLVGLGVGLFLAVGIAFGLSRMLYGLSPFSLPVFATVIALLAGVSLLACYVPARRAARIDPLNALRAD